MVNINVVIYGLEKHTQPHLVQCKYYDILGSVFLGFHCELTTVCRQSSNVTKSSTEASEGKLGVGSKKETRSRRAEILHALGKSTTESDVTEGCDQFHCVMYNYC